MPEDLPETVRKSSDDSSAESDQTSGQMAETMREPEEWLKLEEVEKRYVARVLQHTNGNKQAAARILGIDRKTIERMMKRYDIHLVKTRKVPPHAA